jgi:hypothetical protein
MPAGSRWLSIEGYWLRHWFNAAGSSMEISLVSENWVVGSIFFSSSPHSQIGNVELPPFPFRFEIFDLLANYPEIIETLRYERPLRLYLEWNDSNTITRAMLGTSQEPVGEQEGAGVPPA